jgi:hypothetical protein
VGTARISKKSDVSGQAEAMTCASELFKASTIGGVIHGVYQNARKTKSAPPPAPSES